jgi:PleD family two-component response regulator
MPKMDGFQVLERMNRFHWISEIPVIMISSEEKKDVIERAYIFGAQDYIRRPFDTFIVRRRVQNTLNLYINQKRLKQMVSDQIYGCHDHCSMFNENGSGNCFGLQR